MRERFQKAKIPCTPAQEDQLQKYMERLLEWNEKMNLTAITEPEQVAVKHFLDSALLLRYTGEAGGLEGKSMVDVGTGAGFPGLVLKILCPELRVTLLDSLRKRVDFTSECVSRLGLEGIESLCLRAEEAPLEMRESYDIATSRAVAKLNLLLELCLPFVHTGGVFLAMKGPDCDAEAAEAANAAGQLGGKIREIKRYTVPGTDVVHACVVVDKLSPTPPQFPRRWARMQKKPL